MDKLQRISDDLTDFTNQKEENKDRNIKLIQEIHQMQRQVMAEMITADKNINMIERKMKRRTGDLEMEVKLAKAKERLNILRIFIVVVVMLVTISMANIFKMSATKKPHYISNSKIVIQKLKYETVSRNKQTFDIGLRKFNAFINDWNDSKSVVMANQFRTWFKIIFAPHCHLNFGFVIQNSGRL